MRTPTWRSRWVRATAAVLAAAALVLMLREVAGMRATQAQGVRALPPIDLAAPAAVETATFSLG